MKFLDFCETVLGCSQNDVRRMQDFIKCDFRYRKAVNRVPRLKFPNSGRAYSNIIFDDMVDDV